MNTSVPWVLAGVHGMLALRLGAQLDLRGRLVAEACHEVRGPLTSARLGLHLAARGEGQAPAALGVVERELARVGHALDDLQAARTGARRAGIRTRVDLGCLAADALTAARPVAARYGAELRLGELAEGAWVVGDPRRLAQAAHNLLVNAAEHGGGRVELAVRRRGGRVELAVEDDGPGLPVPLARLAARRSSSFRGHGLAVAAGVAARHGGRLAERASASGARLALELPAAA